jgi:hypothetical protein
MMVAFHLEMHRNNAFLFFKFHFDINTSKQFKNTKKKKIEAKKKKIKIS